MNYEVASVIVFFSVISYMLWKDRDKSDFSKGIIIRRMYTGRRALDAMVKNNKRLFTVLGNLSVIVAIATAFFGTLFLLIFPMIFGQKSLGLVLPTVGGFQYPGPIISIPIWYWLISVFIIMAVHETFHAIMSRLANVRLNNYGLIFFFFLPIGAFVDPDMKKVMRLDVMPRLRIYAAGSFGNFLTALVMICLIFSTSYVLSRTIQSVPIIHETLEGYPAHEVGLSGTVLEVNGIQIESMGDFTEFLLNADVGDELEIVTTDGTYTLTTVESPHDPTQAYLGIHLDYTFYKYITGPYEGQKIQMSVLRTIVFWEGLLSWMLILNVGVAIVNLLPMKPLDGGYIFEEVVKDRLNSQESVKKVTKYVSILVLLLVVYNLVIIDLLDLFKSLLV
jgi:membrane-associated protease RseP (regulator of RpoE activity)